MRWKCDPFRRLHGNETQRDDFHEWILSLPWVVERPRLFGRLGVRTFAINCEPLDIRQVWLVTGLGDGKGIAMIAPRLFAERWESLGLVSVIAPMSVLHVLLTVSANATDTDVERLILESYGTLLS